MQWSQATQQWVDEVFGPGPYLDMVRNGDPRLARVVSSVHDLVTSALYDGIDGSQVESSRPVAGALHALAANASNIRELWRVVHCDWLQYRRDLREAGEAMTDNDGGYEIT